MTDKELWDKYKKECGIDEDKYDAWAFGGDPDELSNLVMRGIKTATASAGILYEMDNEPLPPVNGYNVILNSKGEAVCITQTTRVYIVPFSCVTEEQAYKEGEGDRSLLHWRDVHKRFFTKELAKAGLDFDENMDVVCEEFRLVYKAISANVIDMPQLI